MSSHPDVSTSAARNKIFTVVALALLMVSLDSTIVATALNAIQDDLQTKINLVGWTITGYSFGFILMLPISGKLSEIFGRRRVFLASVVLFTAASLGSGLADNIYMLIGLRILQACGGAGFTPSATGIIVDHFGPSRDKYVSFFGSIFPLGAMAGPIFGGFFVEHLSWHYIFFVNIPIGLAILFFGWRLIPHDKPAKSERRKMDGIGVALLGGGLFSVMLAFNGLSAITQSSNAFVLVAFSLLAVVLLSFFLRHVRLVDKPFIAPRFIHGKHFGTVNLVNMIFSGAVIGCMVLVPTYAQNRYDMSVVSSGTVLAAQAAAAFVCSFIAVMILRRTGYRMPLYVGSIITIIGLILFALEPKLGLSPYAWVALAGCLVGAGNGGINPAMRNAGLQLAPEASSTLASLRTLSLQMGQIVTISMVTAIMAGFQDTAMVMAWVFIIMAVIRLFGMLLIRHVPEQYGSW